MKTILKMIVILFVAALVAGGFYLVVENASSPTPEERPFSAMPDEFRPEPFEGIPGRGEHHDEHSASLAGGMVGILETLLKLTIIIALVLVVEKGISLFGKKRAARPA